MTIRNVIPSIFAHETPPRARTSTGNAHMPHPGRANVLSVGVILPCTHFSVLRCVLGCSPCLILRVRRPHASCGVTDFVDRLCLAMVFRMGRILDILDQTYATYRSGNLFCTPILSAIVYVYTSRYSAPLSASGDGNINADLPLDLAPWQTDVLFLRSSGGLYSDEI